ncbi:MAG: pyridoxine 5'-phosphate synthase [Bdellovibrio sp. CG10_big_fil_rev_8_21_14_0_10_47_8]|nr:MAG: pyridoxine 5'-phosphate synthase [Bdellovibrio sp. CG10_big_fil_rev_8_21_14_0_10_47_8]
MKKKIRLGVNIDHAATLRQVRGGTTPYPDILNIANLAIQGGAEQITIHLREDRRHIQTKDLVILAKKCSVPLNLEMASTDEMVRLARKYKPDWVCMVPEKRQELTTEGGLDVYKGLRKISLQVERLQMIGIEVSMFIEPNPIQIQASFDSGADAVELHTGKWVRLRGRARKYEWNRLINAAEMAHQLGMSVHAGHGLDYQTAKEIKKLPYLQEVNIGHSLICYSLEEGLCSSVRRMKSILR